MRDARWNPEDASGTGSTAPGDVRYRVLPRATVECPTHRRPCTNWPTDRVADTHACPARTTHNARVQAGDLRAVRDRDSVRSRSEKTLLAERASGFAATRTCGDVPVRCGTFARRRRERAWVAETCTRAHDSLRVRNSCVLVLYE